MANLVCLRRFAQSAYLLMPSCENWTVGGSLTSHFASLRLCRLETNTFAGLSLKRFFGHHSCYVNNGTMKLKGKINDSESFLLRRGAFVHAAGFRGYSSVTCVRGKFFCGSVLEIVKPNLFLTQLTMNGISNKHKIIQQRGMAGHSKWQNIRHTKSAKDQQKASLFSKFAANIRVAAKDGGSNDPKLNSELARVIATAKSHDMPNSSISAVLSSCAGKDAASVVLVEMRGPGSCLWVIETLTDKPKRTKAELTGLTKKFGCNLGENNSALGAFEKKGVLEVSLEGVPQPINMDDYLEVAIEVGAEEVQEQLDRDDKPILAFISDPADIHKVKKALEGRQLAVTNHYMDYTPLSPAIVSTDDVKHLQTLLERIQSQPDVLRVYDNIQVQES